MRKFEVILYQNSKGKFPVKEFIFSLDLKMRAKTIGLLELLEEWGNELREPYSKYIDDGIFELRCKVGNNISRIMYFYSFNNKIVLTNGFIKDTKKTPRRELELAKERRKEFLERLAENGNFKKS